MKSDVTSGVRVMVSVLELSYVNILSRSSTLPATGGLCERTTEKEGREGNENGTALHDDLVLVDERKTAWRK